MMATVFGSLLPMLETQMEFVTPGFGLVQSWLLKAFED